MIIHQSTAWHCAHQLFKEHKAHQLMAHCGQLHANVRDDNNQDTASLPLTQIISLLHQPTFFPIPLVGDGAGDTGTKSMRLGDEDADFSKSLSL